MKVLSPLKYHGGKSYLASWIRSQFPPHTRYCEPYFGGGSVLFSGKGEGVAEFANDRNFLLTNFWLVMRSPAFFQEFVRRVQTTPFSQIEFMEACKAHPYWPIPGNEVNSAFWFFIQNRQSRQGLGKDFATPTSRTRRGMNEQVSAWWSAVEGLGEFHQRLRRVEIRNQDALQFIKELDSPKTLFYCDPPYLHETRSTTKEYGEYEMTVEDHERLLQTLAKIKGKFVLSGYPSKLYAKWAKKRKWRSVCKVIDNKASSAKTKQKKHETLWMNY